MYEGVRFQRVYTYTQTVSVNGTALWHTYVLLQINYMLHRSFSYSSLNNSIGKEHTPYSIKLQDKAIKTRKDAEEIRRGQQT